jgi:hypothetical protein
MKIDRFAILLAGLLLVAGPRAEGRGFRVGSLKVSIEPPRKALAKALAVQLGEVQKRFAENRRALAAVRGPDGKPAYLRQEVTGLITRTGEDLDQSIQRVQPSGTEPLRAWAAEEVARIQGDLPRPAGSVASLYNPSAPRAIAVFASSRGFGLPMLAKGKPAPKKPAPAKPAPPKLDTVDAGTANRLLDQLEAAIHQIFLLADHDDLEVKLWVGSAPAEKARFTFWPKGNVTGSTPAPLIIQTDGKKDHVLRGLYSYQAAWGRGAVTQLIKYPDPAAPLGSERLDLVKNLPFFCCQFNEAYCHHVDNEKDCH